METTKKLNLSEIRQSIKNTQSDFLQLLHKSVSPSKLFLRPSPEEWSCGIVFWHISEARLFFTNEIKKGLADAYTEIGRKIDNPIRLAAITEAAQNHPSIEQINARLIDSYTQLNGTLEELTENNLTKTVLHMNPKFGVMELRSFIEHFLVEHDSIHVRQIQRILTQIRS